MADELGPRHGLSRRSSWPRRRDGGGLPRHERGVRPACSTSREAEAQRTRRGGRTGRRGSPGSSSSTCRPTSCATTSTGGPARPGQVRQEELEPGHARTRTTLAPLQVRELRQGDLRRQRHQGGAAVRRALRRSELGLPDQRPDRDGAQRDQQDRRHRAACWRHSVFTPKKAGWMEEVDRRIATSSPTAGRATPSAIRCSRPRTARTGASTTRSSMYPFYEKAVKSGINTICIHKGLLPRRLREVVAGRVEVRHGRRRRQGGQGLAEAQLRHLSRRAAAVPRGVRRTACWPSSRRPAASSWVTDLAEIPAKYGVKNVYGETRHRLRDLRGGQPALRRRLHGHADQRPGRRPRDLGHRLGVVRLAAVADRGDAAARDPGGHAEEARAGRRKLGAADGPVKRKIFGENSARLYNNKITAENKQQLSQDKLAQMKDEYNREGVERNNAFYGYVGKRSAKNHRCWIWNGDASPRFFVRQ